MAKLDTSLPPGDWLLDGDDCFRRHYEQLKALKKASRERPEGTLVGLVVAFPVADGSAWYRVTKARPLTIQQIPYSDNWHIPEPMVNGLTPRNIIAYSADFDPDTREDDE